MTIRPFRIMRIGLLFLFIGYSQNSYNPIIDMQYNKQKGFTVYQKYCAHCHGNNKNGSLAPSLLHLRNHNIDFIIEKIKNGGGNMPRFELKDHETANLISYLID